MLIRNLWVGERITIGDITIRVLRACNRRARLGIETPPGIRAVHITLDDDPDGGIDSTASRNPVPADN